MTIAEEDAILANFYIFAQSRRLFERPANAWEEDLARDAFRTGWLASNKFQERQGHIG